MSLNKHAAGELEVGHKQYQNGLVSMRHQEMWKTMNRGIGKGVQKYERPVGPDLLPMGKEESGGNVSALTAVKNGTRITLLKWNDVHQNVPGLLHCVEEIDIEWGDEVILPILQILPRFGIYRDADTTSEKLLKNTQKATMGIWRASDSNLPRGIMLETNHQGPVLSAQTVKSRTLDVPFGLQKVFPGTDTRLPVNSDILECHLKIFQKILKEILAK